MLWTPSWSFSVINCEDFEDKVKNEGENDVFDNFHHAHRVPESFLRHICQDESSCDSPFKPSAWFYVPCRSIFLLTGLCIHNKCDGLYQKPASSHI